MAAVSIVAAITLFGCSNAATPSPASTPSASATNGSLSDLQNRVSAVEALSPGLGEFMMAFQTHIAKVWYAGENGNWDLAKFENGEIEEGMDGAKASRPPAAPMMDGFVAGPMADLDKAIAAKDKTQFEAAYKEVVQGCNSCHTNYTLDKKWPNGRGFIIITVPTQPPVDNQQWSLTASGQ